MPFKIINFSFWSFTIVIVVFHWWVQGYFCNMALFVSNYRHFRIRLSLWHGYSYQPWSCRIVYNCRHWRRDNRSLQHNDLPENLHQQIMILGRSLANPWHQFGFASLVNVENLEPGTYFSMHKTSRHVNANTQLHIRNWFNALTSMLIVRMYVVPVEHAMKHIHL